MRVAEYALLRASRSDGWETRYAGPKRVADGRIVKKIINEPVAREFVDNINPLPCLVIHDGLVQSSRCIEIPSGVRKGNVLERALGWGRESSNRYNATRKHTSCGAGATPRAVGLAGGDRVA